MFKKLGPGVLVAAAFIGPGTVTTCTLAGAAFGPTLLWAMLLSIIATIVLQEMAARLGVVSQSGLAEVIKGEISAPFTRNLVIILVFGAIVIGNAAYEGGNIGGGALGLEALFGIAYSTYYPWIIGFCAFLLLYFGNYRTLEVVFIGLVLVMSLSFLITAAIVRPDVADLLKGLFVPSVPDGGMLTLIALVGTTVVPYNLFLHASLVGEKWGSPSNLPLARRDTVISVILGGVVSMAVMISATAISGDTIDNAIDLAEGLEPLYGDMARYFIGIGLFAAGITSAITAPLAAAYVAKGCFGWQSGLKNIKFRAVWMVILLLGVLFMSLGIRPVRIITFAQVANGLLLPVIAIFLVWAANRASLLGKYRNSSIQNTLGVTIIILALLLGAKSIYQVFVG